MTREQLLGKWRDCARHGAMARDDAPAVRLLDASPQAAEPLLALLQGPAGWHLLACFRGRRCLACRDGRIAAATRCDSGRPSHRFSAGSFLSAPDSPAGLD
jgi:hypothetical protein